MWVVSEIAAMATDLAEFLGGAVGFSLLLHVPLMVGMVAVGIITYALLLLDRGGFRPLELVIGGLVAAIGVCYLAELLIVPPSWGQAALGAVVPRLKDTGAVTLAVGIFGATVMPHAIYLHSGLTQARTHASTDAERRVLVRFSNLEVLGALTLAGAVNAAMMMMAAAAFHAGHRDVAQIETAYHTLAPLLGGAAAFIFLMSLMASGISSSVVGTMAGQVIMQGFLRRRIPVWLRRLVTMAPAFVVVAAGADVTRCLVISQVVLSLVLPVPMIALLLLSRRRSVMGDFAMGPGVGLAACAAAAVTLGLDGVLVVQSFAG
jgi:manganese transport protein